MSGEATMWPWPALLLLGAAHGVNPGMGWLFAVALGLQEGKSSAVWRALPPLALGHGLAIGAAVLLAGMIGLIVPVRIIKWGVAATLVGVGVYRLVRNRHPRFGGMRASWRDLAVWSFLMASAHGAGLMVLPLVVGQSGPDSPASPPPVAVQEPSAVSVAPDGPHAKLVGHDAHGPGTLRRPDASGSEIAGGQHRAAEPGHAGHGALPAGLSSGGVAGFLAALVHAMGYLLVTGLIAVVVYAKLGLRLLRKAWINLDLVWALALIATGLLTVAV